MYFVVKECYIYSFVVSVDHFPCGNESQFEKWWEDRKQNPVEVAYPIHHSIISNKNKVSQTIFIFCKLKHTKSPPDCVLAVIQWLYDVDSRFIWLNDCMMRTPYLYDWMTVWCWLHINMIQWLYDDDSRLIWLNDCMMRTPYLYDWMTVWWGLHINMTQWLYDDDSRLIWLNDCMMTTLD
jgi:hypothetical protein